MEDVFVSLAAGQATEDVLLASCRDGDEAAFAELITRHRRLIWAVCMRVTANASDAEDALQEALTDIWRGLAGFHGRSGFGTWAYRITSNAALKVAKRRRDIPSEHIPDRPADIRTDFTDALADADLVQRALQSIPETFRVALVLYELCDFTYAQVAEHQGIPIQTVKSRISRARGALAGIGRRLG